ncbi:integrase catalytic domain-containing protein [Trichonephila clavipes]|nr:integrase catalytic domain-containing protein [Trichonephila clavipes]
MILSVAVRAFLQQKQLKQELISLFSGAGMQLHKWSSNCIELLSNFDVSSGDVSLTIPDETKALGLLWRPQKDTLAFSVSSIADVSDSCTITKKSQSYQPQLRFLIH